MGAELQRRVLPEDASGLGRGNGEEIRIPVEVGKAQWGKSALLGAEDVARSPQSQVLLGDDEAIVAPFQDP